MCHHREYKRLEVIFIQTGPFPFCKTGSVCSVWWKLVLCVLQVFEKAQTSSFGMNSILTESCKAPSKLPSCSALPESAVPELLTGRHEAARDPNSSTPSLHKPTPVSWAHYHGADLQRRVWVPNGAGATLLPTSEGEAWCWAGRYTSMLAPASLILAMFTECSACTLPGALAQSSVVTWLHASEAHFPLRSSHWLPYDPRLSWDHALPSPHRMLTPYHCTNEKETLLYKA